MEEKSAVDLTPIVVEDKGRCVGKLVLVWTNTRSKHRAHTYLISYYCKCFIPNRSMTVSKLSC